MITKNGLTAAKQPVPVQPQAPYFRETGSGTSVVCLHSSASSSGQWRALMERLADRFRVIAVDLYGSGKTAAWPQDQMTRVSMGRHSGWDGPRLPNTDGNLSPRPSSST